MSIADLSGKTFIVTGGTQGLGEVTARVCVEQGAAGLTLCGRNEKLGAEVARDLTGKGCPTIFVAGDLEKEADCRKVVRAHDERFHGLAGLANVAASTARGTLEGTTVAEWDAMFALNLRAPFILMQEAVRLMKREGLGGSIVNISSVSGHGGQDFLTAYSTSKGALNILSKNAAHALRKERIRVNALAIGWMSTPNEDAVQRREGKPADWLTRADAAQPYGRILRPGEVAKLVAWLFSDDAALMTGSVIDYDQIVIGARD